MSAGDLLQLVNQALYAFVAAVVVVRALRHPRRATVDTALLFGAVAVVVASGWTVRALGLTPPAWWTDLTVALVMAMPYLLLRLVDDFTDVPPWALRGAEAGLALCLGALLLAPQPLPVPVTLGLVVYFLAVEVFAASVVARAAGRAAGATRRRLQAVAVGSVCLGLVLLVAGVRALLPALAPLWDLLNPALGLASGLGYAVGFATPGWLRRAWREPALRAFMGRAAELVALPDARTAAREIERGAAEALGVPHAAVGLWDEADRVLRWEIGGERGTSEQGEMLVGRAFAEQRPLFTADAPRELPRWADVHRRLGVRAVLAAPITAGARRLGVLCVYGERAPLFAEDDLSLVEALAGQAAVVLQSRFLVDEAARARAGAEMARVREDFLSSAAHDLKTPLTTVLGQAQLLQRVLARDQVVGEQVHRSVDRIAEEGVRLKRLVLELLEAAGAGRPGLAGPRGRVDLAELARAACARHGSERHRCVVDAEGPVVGPFDRDRVAQLVDHLVANAVKFSPGGGTISVAVRAEDGLARLSVTDEGIGVAPEDLPRLFDRFHRGANVDDRRHPGMGLGLYVCRGIAEEHGGRVWATSEPGRGSTFHVELPLGPRKVEAA